jgi:hypothetical protein
VPIHSVSTGTVTQPISPQEPDRKTDPRRTQNVVFLQPYLIHRLPLLQYQAKDNALFVEAHGDNPASSLSGGSVVCIAIARHEIILCALSTVGFDALQYMRLTATKEMKEKGGGNKLR